MKHYRYEIQLNTENDRGLLLTLKNKKHKNYINKDANLIYLYSLVDSTIPYPNKEGKILYIGEACRHTVSSGYRFSQHIESKRSGGRGRNVNYTLHQYYWNGIKLRVDIFDIGEATDTERLNLESYLIKSHLKIWGALPMAQGSSGILVADMDCIDEGLFQEKFNEILF